MTESGFFFQTLTNSFVDFGRLDSYIQDKPDKSAETQIEKFPKAPEPSEKKVSIQMDEIVKRDGTFYRKFSNTFLDILDLSPQRSTENYWRYVGWEKVGNWIEYYLSGIKKSEGEFANGNKDGPGILFLNATIKEKQFFIDGHKDGLWEKFDVHGTVVQTGLIRMESGLLLQLIEIIF